MRAMSTAPRPRRSAGSALLFLACACASPARQELALNDSGGRLIDEQAAYDVLHYDLSVTVDPARRAIDGRLAARAMLLQPLERFVLDLDAGLAVSRVVEGARELRYEHAGGRLVIELGERRPAGTELAIAIDYGGEPRVAPRPPWEGGFTWSETSDGSPWIATSNQGEGGDLWWPCKDHPSDEPESMNVRVRVPEQLVCASNGRV